MNRLVSGAAAFSFIIGLGMAAGGSAHALAICTSYPCVLADTFNGGVSTYGSMTGDTIENPGSHNFEIQGAVITRPTATSVDIKIYTNFAGLSNTAAASPGITYGSVFFGSTASSDATNTPGYTANQWSKAYVIAPYNGAGVITTTSGTGQLYNVGGSATANVYGGPGNTGNVPVSYTTANGTILMSNVNGNPITYPHPGRVPFYFREGQAVRYIPNNAAANQVGTGGTWLIGADAGASTGGGFPLANNAAGKFIEFTFSDAGQLGDDFILAWTMTCGNDVFQGWVSIPPDITPPVPVPGAFVLMGSVLAGLGGLSKWRKRRERKTA